jgi:hypothetical protein
LAPRLGAATRTILPERGVASIIVFFHCFSYSFLKSTLPFALVVVTSQGKNHVPATKIEKQNQKTSPQTQLIAINKKTSTRSTTRPVQVAQQQRGCS